MAATGCGLCGNDLLDRYPSPDQRREAVVFQRDCGATTGFSTQVSLVQRGGRVPTGAGNILVATTDHGAAPAGKGGGPEVRVRWIDSTTLKLAHHAKASVNQPRRVYDGLQAVTRRRRQN